MPQRVLVVDDEPDVLLLCRVNLEFEGYEVVLASNGVDAIAEVRDQRPDVILLDVMMPQKDGWQVLDELQGDPELATIPVVMLTARSQEQDQIRGWSTGVAEYITKPFSPLSLSQVVESVLTEEQEHRARRRALVLEKLNLLQDEVREA